MKKLLFGTILALCLSGAVFAADELVTVNGKSFVLTDVSPSGSDRVIHSKDIQKGICVRVNADMTADINTGRFLATEGLVNARLSANGFKVAEKDGECDLFIRFIGTNSIFQQANDITASSFDSGKLMIHAGAVGGILASQGVAGALGYLAGQVLPMDEKAGIYAIVAIEPKYRAFDSWLIGSGTSAFGKDTFGSNIEIKYQKAKNKEDRAQADAIFMTMIDRWIKKTLVFDVDTSVPAATVPASAVAVAEVVSEVKN